MNGRSRRTLRRLGGLAVLGAVVAAAVVLVPSALSVSTSRTYSATATANVPAGKNSASLTYTITNLGSPALGSANISAPSGFVVSAATLPAGAAGSAAVVGGAIQLRNLNLSSGNPLAVSITADAPCVGGGNWSATVKTNGDFTGQTFTLTGSTPSTTLTGTCTLAFTSQPNNAKAFQNITDVPYNDPSAGNAVAVQALNGDNVQANAANNTVTVDKDAGIFTSTGTGFVNNALALSGGSVSFPNLQSNRTGIDLQLRATATGYTSSSLSNAFSVSVDGKKCASSTCNAAASSTHSSVTANGTGTTGTNVGVGTLDFNVYAIPAGVCSTGPFQPIPGSDGFTEEIQTNGAAQPDYTITLDYDKTIVNAFPQNGVSAVQVCLLAKRVDSVTGLPRTCEQDIADGLTGFPTASGGTAICESTTHMWGGLLPDTGPGINDCADSRLSNPAVLSRNRSGGSGNAHFVIKICKPNPWDGMGGSH